MSNSRRYKVLYGLVIARAPHLKAQLLPPQWVETKALRQEVTACLRQIEAVWEQLENEQRREESLAAESPLEQPAVSEEPHANLSGGRSINAFPKLNEEPHVDGDLPVSCFSKIFNVIANSNLT